MMLVKIMMTNENIPITRRMQRFIAAGMVYLLGVAIILVIKPTLMFTEDGSWKEFGIGRNTNTHTWMPFWFFAILWALTSYILTTIVLSVYLPQKQESLKKSFNKINNDLDADIDVEEIALPPIRRSRGERASGKPMNLPDGYYIMNASATEEAGGVPKYIYLGKGLPD